MMVVVHGAMDPSLPFLQGAAAITVMHWHLMLRT